MGPVGPIWVPRAPLGPSVSRTAGMPRRATAAVVHMSTPAVSAAFSSSVERGHQVGARVCWSSGMRVPLGSCDRRPTLRSPRRDPPNDGSERRRRRPGPRSAAVEAAITDLFRLASSRRLHQARQERSGVHLSRTGWELLRPCRGPRPDPRVAAGRADGPEPAGDQPGAAAPRGRRARGPPAPTRDDGRAACFVATPRGRRGPGAHPGGDARRAGDGARRWPERRAPAAWPSCCPAWWPTCAPSAPPRRRLLTLSVSALVRGRTVPVVRLDLVTIVVDEYDPAIAFFVDALGFDLIADALATTNDGRSKRWVVVRLPTAEPASCWPTPTASASGRSLAADRRGRGVLPAGRRLRGDPSPPDRRGCALHRRAPRRALRAGRRVPRRRPQLMGSARPSTVSARAVGAPGQAARRRG